MNLSRNAVLWIAIVLLLFTLYHLFQSGPGVGHTPKEVPYSDFRAAVVAGQVSKVSMQGDKLTGEFKDRGSFKTIAPNDPALVELLDDHGVELTVKSPEEMSPLLSILITWFPMLLLIGVWIFFMRQMQSGGGKAMGFGKSRARLLTEKLGRVTFDDVAGIDEAKTGAGGDRRVPARPAEVPAPRRQDPQGLLLVGPPGTGKTLLARAIAGEANVPFFTISGSDFVEMFVGVGASRVRDMFEQGKKNAPCIIFIDEIDAVGRHRGAGLGGGNDEREQTLNQLLVEMDGFEANEGVILIAATNRPDVLDPALLRPGRFDRQVVVPNPDILGREKILQGPYAQGAAGARRRPAYDRPRHAGLLRRRPGQSGQRGRPAGRALRQAGGHHADFESAKDKVLMGAERRSMVMTEEEKELTAYHEAGHALVGLFVPGNDPLHKVTIIPRGRALGVTMNLPET